MNQIIEQDIATYSDAIQLIQDLADIISYAYTWKKIPKKIIRPFIKIFTYTHHTQLYYIPGSRRIMLK